jgi:hypothetical protein
MKEENITKLIKLSFKYWKKNDKEMAKIIAELAVKQIIIKQTNELMKKVFPK